MSSPQDQVSNFIKKSGWTYSLRSNLEESRGNVMKTKLGINSYGISDLIKMIFRV